MISPNQIKTLANKYKINESVIVREFVQLTFLKELYAQKFSKNVFFKGGTAIRLLYGGERFSEDLDFTVQIKKQTFNNNLKIFFKKLSHQYPFKFKEEKTITGKSYLLTATIPNIKNNIFVKLDFSMRENVLEPTSNILRTEYPIIIQNFINALSKDEILAEKIRAVLKRKKHRDLYDLWILQELGAQINQELITKKLAYYHEKFDKKLLLDRLKTFNQDNFIQNLRPFIAINQRSKLEQLFEYIMVYLTNSFK